MPNKISAVRSLFVMETVRFDCTDWSVSCETVIELFKGTLNMAGEVSNFLLEADAAQGVIVPRRRVFAVLFGLFILRSRPWTPI